MKRWKQKYAFIKIIIQMKMCFYKKKKKWDLPIDYQTGSCHGGKKDGEGEHKGRVKKW